MVTTPTTKTATGPRYARARSSDRSAEPQGTCHTDVALKHAKKLVAKGRNESWLARLPFLPWLPFRYTYAASYSLRHNTTPSISARDDNFHAGQANMADYARLKVTELRELMRERGVSAAGLTRKQQFIDALLANDQVGISEERVVHEGSEEGQAEMEEDQAVTEDGQAVGEQEQELEQAVSEKSPPISEDEAAQTKEEEEADTRKRKRRSPTPVLSEESMKKKLKAADAVKLPEDGPENYQTRASAPPVANITDSSKSDIDYGRNGADNTTDNYSIDEDYVKIGPPSLHPPTCALYIKNLIRPLHVPSLRDHLTTLSASNAPPTTFHLDFLRTHAFVVFPTVAAAAHARAGLHGHVWPDEPSRKALWIDFVPESSVPGWVEIEVGAKRDGRRWEVVYEEHSTTASGTMEVKLREVRAANSGGGGASLIRRNSSIAGQDLGEGHKDYARQASEQGQQQSHSSSPLANTQLQDRDREHISSPPPSTQPFPLTTDPTTNEPTNTTFSLLDMRYPSTQRAKPRLYFKPQNEDVVSARLRALDCATSRDWPLRSRDGRDIGQWRRYTFEGGRVVDGGPDRGSFGMMEMRGGGVGRYQGRRGGRSRGGWSSRF